MSFLSAMSLFIMRKYTVAIRHVLAAFVCLTLINTASPQSMDPRVRITETYPESDGYRVRGFIATDVWLNCYVENLPSSLQVRWQRTKTDKNGDQSTVDISEDMAVQDNIKWSIEKPTQYSWRLRIRALEIQDEGNYTCFVRLTSNNNRVEANRTVLSTDVPRILEAESSNNVGVREGDFVPLRCNASGRPFPTIMWRREGNAILPGGGVRRMGSILDVSNIPYDARGRYLCEAFNEVGYDRRDIIITVQHSPKITPDLPRFGQAVGYRRTLICHVDGNPSPSSEPESNQLYWSKNSLRIQPTDRISFRVIEGAFNRLTFEMTIGRVEKDDYGTYQCHARNAIGSGNRDIELYETDEPQPDKRGIISAVTEMTLSLTTLVMCFTAALIH